MSSDGRLATVIALLLIAVAVGPMTPTARAQTYAVDLDSVLQTRGGLFLLDPNELVIMDGVRGESLFVAGTVQVVTSSPSADTITVSLDAPDTGSVTTAIPVDPGFEGSLPFTIDHTTFQAGAFSLTVRSSQLGETLLNRTYPVPAYDVAVNIIEPGTGPIQGLQVQTLLAAGTMAYLTGRFDVRYLVDGGVVSQESAVVHLAHPDYLDQLGPAIGADFPETLQTGQWTFTETLLLTAGDHDVRVEIFDHGLGLWRTAAAFNATASGEVEELREILEDSVEELRTNLTEAGEERARLERIAVLLTPLLALSLVALGLGVVAVLLSAGVVRVGRRREP